MTRGVENPAPVLATVIAMPTDDMESHQNKTHQSVAIISPTHSHDNDEEAGKGIGIAMFILLVVGFIFYFINPAVSLVCLVTTIILASILTCGCCCASEYNMKPNVKKFANATLVSLCLMFFVQIVGLVSAWIAVSNEVDNTGKLSSSTAQGAGIGVGLTMALSVILNIMAIVFSAIFTWGRGCGAQQPISATVI
mmetsp:Transcript_11881/g.25542  ORF Transcript_11881/g.25542 Transcript_11881/m.25542 type:complete len:195 (+) Transcript_11881:152-736(+)